MSLIAKERKIFRPFGGERVSLVVVRFNISIPLIRVRAVRQNMHQ